MKAARISSLLYDILFENAENGERFLRVCACVSRLGVILMHLVKYLSVIQKHIMHDFFIYFILRQVCQNFFEVIYFLHFLLKVK